MINGMGARMMTAAEMAQKPMFRNVTTNTDSLSFREAEILNKIREMVSNSLGVCVKLNKGQKSECGLRFAFLGMVGGGADRVRPPFLITQSVLAEMAECADKYRKWMSWVQEEITGHLSLENSLANNLARTKAEDGEKDSRNFGAMWAADFWLNMLNESKNDTQATRHMQNQILKRILAGHEQMLV